VIVKLLNNDIPIFIITRRRNFKGTFLMLDHIKHMNAKLLKDLKSRTEVIDSAWFYNGYIFEYDKKAAPQI
jgi:hypothetical protein